MCLTIVSAISRSVHCEQNREIPFKIGIFAGRQNAAFGAGTPRILKISEFWRACRRLGPATAQARFNTHTWLVETVYQTQGLSNMFDASAKFGSTMRLTIGN